MTGSVKNVKVIAKPVRNESAHTASSKALGMIQMSGGDCYSLARHVFFADETECAQGLTGDVVAHDHLSLTR